MMSSTWKPVCGFSQGRSRLTRGRKLPLQATQPNRVVAVSAVLGVPAPRALDVAGDAEDDLLLIEAAVEDRELRLGTRAVAAIDDGEVEEDVPLLHRREHGAHVEVEARLRIDRQLGRRIA